MGKVSGDLGHQSDGVKPAVKLLSEFCIVMRSKSPLSPPQTCGTMGELVNTVHSVRIAVYPNILSVFLFRKSPLYNSPHIERLQMTLQVVVFD